MASLQVPQAVVERTAALYADLKSAPLVADRMGISERTVRRYLDRAGIARNGHLAIVSADDLPPPSSLSRHPHRIRFAVENGIVLIGSDGHYWPGPASTMHRAFVQFCEDMRPEIVIMNGDALDGARVSRHARIGWESRPYLIDELRAVQERLSEIEEAAPDAQLSWNLGNHDARFETRLAAVAPEYESIKGVHLKDHFSDRWAPAWSTWINDDLVVKHRYKGGTHAAHNNVVSSGKSIATGHLHSAKVSPFTDYNGTRYGVDLGCLCDPDGPQFVDYTEDAPKNWRAAFGVFTFYRGKLLQPELVLRHDDDHVEFRGQVIPV